MITATIMKTRQSHFYHESSNNFSFIEKIKPKLPTTDSIYAMTSDKCRKNWPNDDKLSTLKI